MIKYHAVGYNAHNFGSNTKVLKRFMLLRVEMSKGPNLGQLFIFTPLLSLLNLIQHNCDQLALGITLKKQQPNKNQGDKLVVLNTSGADW